MKAPPPPFNPEDPDAIPSAGAGGDPLFPPLGHRHDNSPEVLKLRGCLSRGAITILLLTSAAHAIVLLRAPHLLFDGQEGFFLESLDQLAFQAMLLGFAGVLWRPQRSRPFLLLGKGGFCFQLALGTGGQSFTAFGPRLVAIAFMLVSMWYLLSRLGIGVLWPPAEGVEPPP